MLNQAVVIPLSAFDNRRAGSGQSARAVSHAPCELSLVHHPCSRLQPSSPLEESVPEFPDVAVPVLKDNLPPSFEPSAAEATIILESFLHDQLPLPLKSTTHELPSVGHLPGLGSALRSLQRFLSLVGYLADRDRCQSHAVQVEVVDRAFFVKPRSRPLFPLIFLLLRSSHALLQVVQL